ncbi:tRNA guanosine(34) transglycosylase Tgt [Nanoarchaeota archaeon]
MFEVLYEDGKARVGKLKTAHGVVETPFLMPVATKATAKFVSPLELADMADSIICNSMILHLKPGSDFIKEAGGLHKFMNYKKTIFTDSGGFQMQTPSLFLQISDKKVIFKNPFTYEKTRISPEDSMKIQIDIGSDVAMCLDHMPHTNQDKKEWEDATRRTHLWAERCKKHHDGLKEELNSKQLLFGIAQGGLDKELRIKSAEFIDKLDFDGVAMGGLCLGESKEAMFTAMDVQIPLFNTKKPRYLMGVGTPNDLIEAIAHGADCFDSIFPTKNARHAHLFTSKGMIKLDRGVYAKDFGPIDEKCDCYVCKNFTKAYLRYLFMVGEHTVNNYLSYHNVYYTQNLMKEIRKAIKENRFEEFRKDYPKTTST